MKKPSNIHPGEVLLEEFLLPMGISHNVLAHAIGVPPRRIDEIVLGKRDHLRYRFAARPEFRHLGIFLGRLANRLRSGGGARAELAATLDTRNAWWPDGGRRHG
jgi:hypothetical protein